ncbi:MAG: multicopper oxidase domain-containing protein [Acidimicrobiales bacterium]
MASPDQTAPYAAGPQQERLGGSWFLILTLGGLAIVMAFMLGIAAIGILAGDGGGASATPSTRIDVTLAEFTINGNLVAPEGEVTLVIKNDGSMDHNVGVRELGLLSPNVGAGGVVELALGELNPGTYEVYCDIAGHADSGMVAVLTVSGSGETVAAASSGGGTDHSNMTDEEYAAMDTAMMESMLAYPAETEGKGNQILEPTEVLADGTKVFDLEASIVQWEKEPGLYVDAWAYNGMVPGPKFDLDRGDKFRVRFTNNLPMGTDIHWHGVHTPNDMDGVAPYTQDLIEPHGGTFVYEFVVDDDAIGMYHAHNHAQTQVVNGMFGAFVVGENPAPWGMSVSGVDLPEDGEFAVDMPMILNDAGTIGLSLNGKSFPATEPLVLNQGEWASVTYYNEGLQIHPMHLHQFPQLVYAKDGIPLEQPYWTDTLNIAPGERYTVMFRADDAGVWVWHCHILTHVERSTGMFGMVTAIIVNETPGFDPNDEPVRPSNWRLNPNHSVAEDGTNPGGVTAEDLADAQAEADAADEAEASASSTNSDG